MPKGLEQKNLPIFEAKMADGDGNGELTGYAAVKNNVDSYGDVILDGAFVKLDEMLKAGYSGFNHGDEPVGYFKEIEEDTKGLRVKIAFHSTGEAQKIRTIIAERIAAGKDVGMSIMYRTLDSSWGERDGKEVRELKAIETVEAGFVTIPANKAAMVTAVKDGTGATIAEDFDLAREQVEKVIDRIADLKESASGELSRGRVEIVKQLHEKCGELLDAIQAKAEEEEPEMATDEQIDEVLSAITE